MRSYLTQLRQECGSRLVERVFLNSEDGKPSKWWTCFSKRKFMDLTLGSSGLWIDQIEDYNLNTTDFISETFYIMNLYQESKFKDFFKSSNAQC